MSSTVKSANQSPAFDLTICIVAYRPNLDELRATWSSLDRALEAVPNIRAKLFFVDNSPPDNLVTDFPLTLAACPVEVIAGHGNIGFAAANNMMLGRTGIFHLALNPDVQMEPNTLKNALDFMNGDPDTGLLTPQSRGHDGIRQYLCKRYPAIFDLALRGFAPAGLKTVFRKRLARYEMRSETDDGRMFEPEIVSGCFMFFRGDVFERLGGFDQSYFLYFEDFDLSLRAGLITKIVHVPSVKIIHGGGNSARKGMWHVGQFARSALIFYSAYKTKIY